MDEIQKIKFHLALLAEALDSRDHPIPTLVISLDWGQEQLSQAHDIFQKYDNILESDEVPNWNEFENEFAEQMGIHYQRLKSIVLSFYRNHQWTDVCSGYALAKPVSEFYEILRSAGEVFENQVAEMLNAHGFNYSRNARISTGPNSVAEVDFLLTLGREKIAIEAKRTVTAATAHNLAARSALFRSSKASDTFVVASENCTPEARAELKAEGVSVLMIDELELFLSPRKLST